MTGLKLPGWQPNKQPPKERKNYVRNLSAQMVYARNNGNKTETSLNEATDFIQEHVRYRIRDSKDWPANWGWVIRRSINRRLNEACEPSWYEDGVPRLASPKAGFWVPNPHRFQT